MPTDFDDKSECQASLRRALNVDPADIEVSAEFLDALLVGFCDACEEPPPETPPGVFRVQWDKWVIRDEDLKLFSTIKDVLIPMAAVGYAFSSIGSAGVTALVLALIDLGRKLLLHGCELTERQAKVVCVLKSSDHPMTSTEILALLPSTEAEEWTELAVDQQLGTLQTVATEAGVKQLVKQLSDGNWWLEGV